jgi:hypothetical protein
MYCDVQPELGENGWTSRTTQVSEKHLMAVSDNDRDDESTILLELLPDKPCLIVPSTLESGVEGRFELRYALIQSCSLSTSTAVKYDSNSRQSFMQDSECMCN